MKFTIITPIFNRANFIKRLYQSISNQKANIEWIIVNDGSTDDIDNEVEKIQELNQNQKNLTIHYLKKENGGKHTAVNLGLNFATGKWTVILDSDDILKENCMERVEEKIISLSSKQIQEISGFIFLYSYPDDKENTDQKYKREGIPNSYPDGKIIGQKYKKEGIPMYHYERAKVRGDKLRVTKTNLLKEHLFPIYKKENFVTENTIWNVLESIYPVIPYNMVAIQGDYLSDGLTSRYDELIELNHNGTFHYVIVSLKVTGFNLLRYIGLYREIFGHYFHIRSFKKNVQLIQKFKGKGIYFLFWFYIYRTIAYIFYNDFKKK